MPLESSCRHEEEPESTDPWRDAPGLVLQNGQAYYGIVNGTGGGRTVRGGKRLRDVRDFERVADRCDSALARLYGGKFGSNGELPGINDRKNRQ